MDTEEPRGDGRPRPSMASEARRESASTTKAADTRFRFNPRSVTHITDDQTEAVHTQNWVCKDSEKKCL